MISEFDLIRRYFSRPAPSAVLGVGDDCALVTPKPGTTLALSTDMLLAGRHFAADADPGKLGHKSLAVNLSDLAAMGADPCWAMLALALPAAEDAWLSAFAGGFFALADRYGVELIGGDTNRGPMTIAVTVIGELPEGLALRRDGARAGDDIWISGATGEAALALAHVEGRVELRGAAREACMTRLHTPEPRIELGRRLRSVARSAIDVSDGLLADLEHVLESSGVGARVSFESVPRAAAIATCRDERLATECVFAGGDDYELLFAAAPSRRDEIQALSVKLGIPLTRIGTIVPGRPVIELRDRSGAEVPAIAKGFDHFA